MKVVQLFVIAITVSIFGCTMHPVPSITGDPDQDALNKNLSLWNSAHLSTYSYTYKRMCFCPEEEDIVVKVQYGDVVSAFYSPSNTPVLPDRLDDLMTIEKFFLLIQDAISKKVAELDVTYNAEFGYPERIFIDVDKLIADEEITHFISKLHSGLFSDLFDESSPGAPKKRSVKGAAKGRKK